MKPRGRSSEADPALAALARVVVRHRQAAKLTQEEAAHEAGLSLRHYQNLESGALNPSYHTLRAVAKGLAVRLGELVAEADRR